MGIPRPWQQDMLNIIALTTKSTNRRQTTLSGISWKDPVENVCLSTAMFFFHKITSFVESSKKGAQHEGDFEPCRLELSQSKSQTEQSWIRPGRSSMWQYSSSYKKNVKYTFTPRESKFRICMTAKTISWANPANQIKSIKLNQSKRHKRHCVRNITVLFACAYSCDVVLSHRLRRFSCDLKGFKCQAALPFRNQTASTSLSLPNWAK